MTWQERAKKLAAFLAVLAVLAGGFALWVRGKAIERIEECDDAMESYIVNGGEQPSILTEDWCFERTTGLEAP